MSGQVERRTHEIHARWLGTTAYGDALETQNTMMAARKSDEISDTLLLLEHPHVITFGRRADDTHLVTTRKELELLGVEIYETNRGGEATYHGPGQLVGYPIIDVRVAELGPVTYVRMLEQSIIDTLAEFEINAHLVNGETGVWVGGEPNEKKMPDVNPSGKKIAAIGVRISGGVTMHGFALNVATDLSYFQHIIPCGMQDLPFTSVAIETGSAVTVSDCATAFARHLAANLDRELTWP
ncbi:MAG: lipoyl(octanoyl) transferase LipB, partial [Dehalococcoidia bacterium]